MWSIFNSNWYLVCGLYFWWDGTWTTNSPSNWLQGWTRDDFQVISLTQNRIYFSFFVFNRTNKAFFFIWRMFGTPTEETWPGVTTLCANLQTYPKFRPMVPNSHFSNTWVIFHQLSCYWILLTRLCANLCTVGSVINFSCSWSNWS